MESKIRFSLTLQLLEMAHSTSSKETDKDLTYKSSKEGIDLVQRCKASRLTFALAH